MLTEVRDWWEKHAQQYQRQSQIPIDILYGPGAPNEDRLQLIGDVRGKTVLEIGCGAAQATIALAQRGATVTALDVAESSLQLARELAATHHVAIRFLQADMANLSGIAAASQDVVFPACALAYADDLPAFFAEVKRVLIPGGLFLLSVGHPFQYAVDSQALALHRSYFDTGPHVEGDGKGGTASRHTTEPSPTSSMRWWGPAAKWRRWRSSAPTRMARGKCRPSVVCRACCWWWGGSNDAIRRVHGGQFSSGVIRNAVRNLWNPAEGALEIPRQLGMTFVLSVAGETR